MNTRPSLAHPAVLLSTWFGSGYLRPAPGTWGTLAALPFAWVIHYFVGQWGLLAASLTIFVIGIWSSQRYSDLTSSHDAGEIVIDEVAGIWLTLAFAPLSWTTLIAGFLFFRLTDITKPFPAGYADKKLTGGIGIMTDDMIAGLYAGLALWLIKDNEWLPHVPF